METFYLVDYENVREEGLLGCRNLKKTDHILVFFTQNAKKMDLRTISGVDSSNLQYIEVPVGKQSADMHIGSYMGFLIGQNQSRIKIVVISKDTDYDKLIDFWGSKADICRKEKIEVVEKDIQTSKKLGKKQTSNSVKAENNNSSSTSQIKTKLNMDIQKELSKAGYNNNVISTVAKLVVKRYDNDNFKRDVHEELRNHYTNFDEVYKVIKPVLSKYR